MKSIGACTNNLALCIYTYNGEGIATATKLYYFTRHVLHLYNHNQLPMHVLDHVENGSS